MSEILGTLFKYLMAILAVGAVVAITLSVSKGNKTSNAITDISQLATNVQVAYNQTSTFTTITPAAAVNGKMAPDDLISGATLVDPWGGTDTLAVNATIATEFDFGLPAVPQGECTKLATSIKAVALKIGTAVQTFPLDPAAVAAACSASTPIAMTFTFGH